MKSFFVYLWIQLKMDLRDKGTLMNFYLVPLVFFFIMGAVFSSINPVMKTTLAATMSIFTITMGAVMGAPAPLVKMRESGTMRAFSVNGIPASAVLAVQGISAFIHLLIVSVIVFIASPMIYHATVPKQSGIYFAVIALFLFTSIGIGLLIGVAAKGQSVATMLSMCIFMPSLLLSGIMFPATMLPKTFLWLGRIFPATYALQALDGFAYQTATNISADISVAVIAGIGLLMFAVALWRLRIIQRSEQI